MNIGIVGLGLIGGSLAKAIRKNTEHTVLGYDISEQVQLKAKVVGAIDNVLTKERLSECDIVIIALYPSTAVEFVEKHKEQFNKNSG